MIRRQRKRAVRPWIVAWVGGAGIGVANGVLRAATYAKALGERAGHQVSGATAMAGFAAYFSWLQRRWPLRTNRDAARVGIVWLAATVAFEFGFGRAVAKQSWEELLSDYDLRHGRTWPLVLAWIGIGPSVVRWLRS